MKRLLSVLVVSALVGFVGCNTTARGEVEKTDERASEVIGGTTHAGHPAVLLLNVDGHNDAEGYDYFGTCTASLIAPDTVLTAAHCVADYVKNHEKGRVSNQVTPDRANPAHWTNVTSVEIHPAWATQQYINQGHDCAILKLAAPISGVTPVPVYRGTNVAADLAVGNAVQIIGYGNTVGDPGTGAGTKRYVGGAIKEVYDGVIGAGVTGATSCQGDSGGGLIATIGGKEQVIGVTSFGSQGCVDSGYWTNVSKTCLDLVRKYVPDDPGTCQAACSGKVCGADGCGGSCGTCGAGTTCSANGSACEGGTTCTPACQNKNCGDDGCGGTCGSCSSGETCDGVGRCVGTVNDCSETEPNNTALGANKLCEGGKYTGTTDGTDYDYVMFNVTAGRTYTLKFDSASANANFVLYKQAASGYTQIGQGPGELARSTPTGGTYYAITWSTDSASASYALSIAK